MRKVLATLIVVVSTLSVAISQELDCTITINSDQVSLPDKTIFRDMQTNLQEFMNSNKFTSEEYKREERIKCSLLITIKSYDPNTGKAEGFAQVQSSRPVYGTDYETTVFNFLDKDWFFDYMQGQPLFYSENSASNNLTAILTFYAYVIIAMDNDTFSKLGGQKMAEKAQSLVQLAQSLSTKGWKAFDGQQNRFWVSENILNTQLAGIREGTYTYHRVILDDFNKDQKKNRQEVIKLFEDFKKIEQLRPGTQLMRIFFDSKVNEIIRMMKMLEKPDDKQKVYDLLRVLDVTNATKYNQILQR